MMYLTKEQEAEFRAFRKVADDRISTVVDKPVEINSIMLTIRPWKPAVYALNDVRVYEGIPYKCVQAHDSTSNPDWTPEKSPALWMQYHGTSLDTARPWVQPAGAHDMYKVGEYMIWTDGNVYRCIHDTTFSPDVYADAWKVV